MSPTQKPTPRPKRRDDLTAGNPDHHLWRHGKNWWVYCAVYPTPRTKDKLRRSLATESLAVARFRRDELFRRLQAEGLLGRIRQRLPAGTPLGDVQPVVPGQSWKQRVDAALAVVMSLETVGLEEPTPRGRGRNAREVLCA